MMPMMAFLMTGEEGEAGAGPGIYDLLLETGDFLLLEDGVSHLILEP